MLHIEHLTKAYGEKKAVDDLTPPHRPRRDLRLHRPQRRGQDHHTQIRRGHPAIRRGRDHHRRHVHQDRPAGLQAADGLHPGQPRPLRVHDRHQVPELHRRHLRRQRGGSGRPASASTPARFELTGRPGPAHRRLFPRHEAEAGHHLRLAPPAEAHPDGRALRGPGPQGRPPAQGHDAGALRRGRRHLLLHPRAGGGGKALRQGGHHQGRQAHPLRHHGGGQGRRVAWSPCSWNWRERHAEGSFCKSSWRRSSAAISTTRKRTRPAPKGPSSASSCIFVLLMVVTAGRDVHLACPSCSAARCPPPGWAGSTSR